jgi:site-specific DNA recombinase
VGRHQGAAGRTHRALSGPDRKLARRREGHEGARAAASTQETNRLNRERRDTAETTRRELAETDKAIREIVAIIEKGGWYKALTDRLGELERKQEDLAARLIDAPQDVPDIHPGIAETFRRRIERLTEALGHPDDALEAADALREVIDRIVITPGETRKDLSISLQGELGAILDWIERSGKPGYKPKSHAPLAQMSASVRTRDQLDDPDLSGRLGAARERLRGLSIVWSERTGETVPVIGPRRGPAGRRYRRGDN